MFNIPVFSQFGSGGYGEHLPVQEALYHPYSGSAGELPVWELARTQRPVSAAAAAQRLSEAGRHPAWPRFTLCALQHAVHPQRPGEWVIYLIWHQWWGGYSETVWCIMLFLCRIPPNDYKLVVCDIQQLLVAVTIHSCSSSGSQYFRIIEDLITLLGYMQTSKVRRTQGKKINTFLWQWYMTFHSNKIGNSLLPF